MAKSPKYARVGERVRIVTPKIFERVGYPLTLNDIREKFQPEIKNLMQKVGAALGVEDIYTWRSHLGLHVERGICSWLLEREGWGGKERKIYERDPDMSFEYEISGKEGRVLKRRSVKTGMRVPGCGGWSYDGDYDYELPYLQDEKVHVVYTIELFNPHGVPYPVQILASHCEVIR